MPELLFETAFRIDEETGELVSYWPERWPVGALVKRLRTSGSAFFAASYMNDPTALEGNSLKTSWLHTYSQTELEAARAELKVERGVMFCGLDPSVGGNEASDLDFFGMFAIEVLGTRGFCRGFHFERLQLEDQGKTVEGWLDLWRPDFTYVEEASSKGFVYTALTTQVNDGMGSKWSIEVRHSQGTKDKGGKRIRLQKMASRFQGRQLLLPGEGGEVEQSWSPFVSQWRTFPSGHDDILDAAYWAQYEAFEATLAAGVSKKPEVDKKEPLKATIVANPKSMRGINSVMQRHNQRRLRMRTIRASLRQQE